MNGLFLQGGGAKGAFQAGVIYGLMEKGRKFNILAGTSIGAINGYFVYNNQMEALKETWTHVDEGQVKHQMVHDRVIENQALIERLNDLQGENKAVTDFYVNYIKVNNGMPKEVSVDVAKVSKEEGIKAIKYSSLLPYVGPRSVPLHQAMETMKNKVALEQFKHQLGQGTFDGYALDGGLMNNHYLSQFVHNRVDKLYIITFTQDYQVPDYIKEIYQSEELVIIEPKNPFEQGDTLRFEQDFCQQRFMEGYEVSQGVHG